MTRFTVLFVAYFIWGFAIWGGTIARGYQRRRATWSWGVVTVLVLIFWPIPTLWALITYRKET